MRPLSLAIEGLTSFREQQQIELSELDLFVITGATGAGKSSILDAMTFALYGRVARVNRDELRDLISHGCADMRVRLEFEVDGTRYRVARRMSKTKHDVSLERLHDGASTTELERGGVQAVNDRLEEIIGLDFGAFTKAVLLPQGAFHEFLRGDKAERRRILTRLLDLNRYERAGQAARREATRLDAIVGERQALIESNYQDATDERLADLRTAVQVSRDRYDTLTRAREEGRQIAKAGREAQQTIATLTQAAGRLEDARSKLESLADTWPPLESEVTTARQDLADTDATLREAEAALEQARKSLAGTEQRTGDSALLARLEEAASAVAREQEELIALKTELGAAHEEANKLEEALHDVETDLADKKRSTDAKSSARKQAEDAKRQAEAIKACADRAEALAAIEEQLAPVLERAQKLEQQAEQARDQLAHLQQDHAALALRAGLEPGDRCPVCESVIEALPESDHHVDELLSQAGETLKTANSLARAAKDQAVTLEARRQTADEELHKARALLGDEMELPSHENAIEALSAAQQALVNAEAAKAAADEALQQANDALAEIKTQVATVREKTTGLTSKQHDAKQRMNAAETTLLHGFGGVIPPDINGALTARLEELHAAENERDGAAGTVETAREARDEAQAVAASAAGRVAAFDNQFATAKTAARITCETVTQVGSGESWPALPADDADRTNALTLWAESCDRYLSTLQQVASRKEEEVEDALDELKRLAAETELEVSGDDLATLEIELERALTTAHGIVVAAEKDVETLSTRIEERRKLEEAIASDRQQQALYSTLANDLRNDHFVAWVLEESMNQLADQASIELLRISDSRYSLVADGGNFDVVDHYNADEHRSVATLSGGETFLASLSLALALAAGLRELGGSSAARLEAVFIDEGFGALDPETLDVVVDALERLQQSDRMVGVITHVPTLAERIPTGLLVEKNGNSSRILVR